MSNELLQEILIPPKQARDASGAGVPPPISSSRRNNTSLSSFFAALFQSFGVLNGV